MKLFKYLTIAVILTVCCSAIKGWPVSRTQMAVKTLMEIPQWHCLRYFKHDVQLIRRCRNLRIRNIRKPSK